MVGVGGHVRHRRPMCVVVVWHAAAPAVAVVTAALFTSACPVCITPCALQAGGGGQEGAGNHAHAPTYGACRVSWLVVDSAHTHPIHACGMSRTARIVRVGQRRAQAPWKRSQRCLRRCWFVGVSVMSPDLHGALPGGVLLGGGPSTQSQARRRATCFACAAASARALSTAGPRQLCPATCTARRPPRSAQGHPQSQHHQRRLSRSIHHTPIYNTLLLCT